MTGIFKINIESLKDKDGYIYYKANDLVYLLDRIGHREAADIIESLLDDETEDS